MKKVLITGITGLVGSAFTIEVCKRNSEVKFLAITRGKDDISAKERVRRTIVEQCEFDGLEDMAESVLERIEVVEGDISDSVHVAMASGLGNIDAIFHCAADVNLGADPTGKTFNANVRGTETLLQIGKELGVGAFHYVSTAYVAGKTEGTVMEDSLPAKDWHNAYEKSKFDSETLVRSSNLPFTIHRPSIIVGRRSDGKIRKPLAFYFILEFLAIIKERQCAKRHIEPSEWLDMPLRLEATPSDNVYFVPIDYVAETSAELFLSPPEGKTYHITGNSPVSTKSIDHAVQETLKVKNVKIVDRITDQTSDEKLLHRFLGEFLPYFGSEAKFDTSNIVERFGERSLEWDFSGDKLKKFIGSFYRDNFPELTDVVV